VKKRELQEQLDAAHAEIARLVHIGDLRKREMQQLWRPINGVDDVDGVKAQSEIERLKNVLEKIRLLAYGYAK